MKILAKPLLRLILSLSLLFGVTAASSAQTQAGGGHQPGRVTSKWQGARWVKSAPTIFAHTSPAVGFIEATSILNPERLAVERVTAGRQRQAFELLEQIGEKI